LIHSVVLVLHLSFDGLAVLANLNIDFKILFIKHGVQNLITVPHDSVVDGHNFIVGGPLSFVLPHYPPMNVSEDSTIDTGGEIVPMPHTIVGLLLYYVDNKLTK
jgi:hypothetical protein